MIRVGVLTSSRADYGIYKPLLDALKSHKDFDLSIIAFGTHLSHFHGYTLQAILKDGFDVRYTVNSMLLHDDVNSIATAFALTALKFADFWKEHAAAFDLVFCLGDRYEMFGAVSAGIPFNIKFAHLHGGETTLGAIDNIYRHAITLSAAFHFTSNEQHTERVKQLIGSEANAYTVGALSLDNLESIPLYTKDQFLGTFGIPVKNPFFLITYHPETVSPEQNQENIDTLCQVIRDLKGYTSIISLPNADTFGSSIRLQLQQLKDELGERIVLVESFGTKGYFSCMKYCSFLLGNSSSGIIEAASFNKYVINMGKRQAGRLSGDNVFNCPVDYTAIMEMVRKIQALGEYSGNNLYHHGGATNRILEIIKKI